jgi:hypothetical protein
MSSRPLPLAQPQPDTGACCNACAPAEQTAAPARQSGPRSRAEVTAGSQSGPSRRALAAAGEQSGPSRRALAAVGERRVTTLAIALAVAFAALALLSLVAPPQLMLGSWVPVHLLLAAAAPTAIAGVMPYFSAAVASVPPVILPVRLAGVLGVSIGAGLVIVGRGGWVLAGADGALLAGVGGVLYLGGVLAVAAATLLPLRLALGPRRIFMGATYGVALLNVFLGAGLATLFVLGWGPVLAAWGALKPAHAWLNVFGFVSLVIAGSLLHLLPTVAGARIRRTRASMIVFAGLAFGPGLAALGFVLGADTVAIGGAALTLLGAVALVWQAVTVLRARAGWTTDRAWHLFTTWSLIAAIGWFAVAATIAAGQVLSGGAAPAGWALAPLLVPIGVGWAGQTLAGSWSHLLPAIGPGTLEQHARQRHILGQAAVPRLVLLNGGAALLVAGQAFGVPVLATAGAGAVIIAGAGSVALFVGALLPLTGTRVVREPFTT